MRGLDRLRRRFEPLSPAGGGGRIGLMAHAVCGFPDLAGSARILAALARGGADFIEAQLPFSDPIADGPAIVAANRRALESGAGTGACLDLLAGLRREAEGTPILVMSYLNPIFAYGPEAFLDRVARAGLDGLIVPDYPDDEPELGLAEKCEARGLALVPLIAPTTDPARAKSLAASSASPFLYAITRLGVTGRSTLLEAEALARLAELRRLTGRRIAAGFGIREGAQIEALAQAADCAVVGSVLLEAATRALAAGLDPASAVEGAFAELRRRSG